MVKFEKSKKSDNELVKLAKENDEGALIVLMERYAPLIGKMATKYYGLGYDYQDFFQDGRTAFINAIKTFDLSKGATFHSYSLTCVRNALVSSYRKIMKKTGLDLLVDDIELIAFENIAQNYEYVDRLDTYINNKKIVEDALSNNGPLSELEKICLKELLTGKNCLEISKSLSLSSKQVENALSRCKTKLKGLNNSN